MLVSIIIITYNRSGLLEKTLRSVLNQSVKDLEVIVVDDGSDDDTFSMTESFNDDRIKYINFGRIGNLSRLRNLGIKNSNSDFIAFSDDDDLWKPERLKTQMNYAGEYDFICSNADVIDINDRIIKEKYFDDINASFEISKDYLLSRGNCILTSSCLIKRKIFSDNDCFFDEKVFTNFCEDYELFIRLSDFCKMYFIENNLIQKRSHESVSGGLENILKMLDMSSRILTVYTVNHDAKTESLAVEGILGFKILRVRYSFEKSFMCGVKETAGFIKYLTGFRTMKIFLNVKVKNKIKKFLS